MIWEIGFGEISDDGFKPPDDSGGWEPFGVWDGKSVWRACKWEHKDIEGNEGAMSKLLIALAEEAWKQADDMSSVAAEKIMGLESQLAQLKAERAVLEREMDRERKRGYANGYQAGIKRNAKALPPEPAANSCTTEIAAPVPVVEAPAKRLPPPARSPFESNL